MERFEVCLWTSPQADKARGFGARIYCVGVMDFDHKQVWVFVVSGGGVTEFKG